jgi:Yip1 domain.
MNMSGFTDVFTNPTRFFRDRGEKEPSFRTPLLIMFLWVIIAVITAMFLTAPLTEKIMSTYPEEIAAYASFTKYFSVFGSVLTPFIMWLILGVVFFVISYFLKGKGTFKKVLEFTSYGFIPMIFSGIATFALQWNVIPGLIDQIYVGRAASIEEIGVVVQQITQQYQNLTLNNPYFLASHLINILCMLWSANIWICGVKYARSLSTGRALITVIIPVAVWILYLWYTVFGKFI